MRASCLFMLLALSLFLVTGCDDESSEGTDTMETHQDDGMDGSEEPDHFEGFFEGSERFDCDAIPVCLGNTLALAETCAQGLTFTGFGFSCRVDTFSAFVDSWDNPAKIDIADSHPASQDPLWCASYEVKEGSGTYSPTGDMDIPYTYSTMHTEYTSPNHQSQSASLTLYDSGYVKVVCEDSDFVKTNYHASLSDLESCQSDLRVMSILGSKSSVTVTVSPMGEEGARPIFSCVQGE